MEAGNTLKPGETMCFHVEDGSAFIWDWDPKVFEHDLIVYFRDSCDLHTVYEEELKEYDDGETCTEVFTKAWYGTEPGYVDYRYGRVPASIYLVAGEVLRVERGV